MAKTKKPTVDTCVVSNKPIRQKHLDDNLVIKHGKGHAFISAVQKTVHNPSENPVVFSAQDVSVVSLTYTRHHFPSRVTIKGKSYKQFPEFIYIQNQIFKLNTNQVIHYFAVPEDLTDKKIEIGLVLYQLTKERPKSEEEVDKASDK